MTPDAVPGSAPVVTEPTPDTVREERPPASEPRPVWDPRLGRWHEGVASTAVFPLAAEFGSRDGAARRPGMWLMALLGGIVGAAVAVAAVWALADLRPSGVGTPVERLIEPGLASPGKEGSSIVEIARRARPWVVNVSTQAARGGLFGGRVAQGTGSGVIIRSDGHIVTNAHVIDGAQTVQVTLSSGEEIDARVVAADRDTDVAVLKVSRADLPSALIGSVKDVQVGELAVAIGSPLGLEQTVTSGIISALGRRVDRTDQGLPPLVDMIQTDTPITQGNSGGALINGRGALIGINTAIAASPDVGAEGIAFAIPIDIAKKVADQLIAEGRATHPYIGVQGTNIDAQTAREFGRAEGALIVEVVPEGPADRAGLRERDVVVGFGGETVTSMEELVLAIRNHEVGETVEVDIVRDGETMTLELTIGDRPDSG